MDRLIDLTGPQTAAEALDGWVLPARRPTTDELLLP